MADTASGAGAAAAAPAPAAASQQVQEVPSTGVNKKLAEQMSKVSISRICDAGDSKLLSATRQANPPLSFWLKTHLYCTQMPEGLFRQVVLFL